MNFYDYEAEDAGFEILDFPCNQFGNQAPGTTEEIASFCDAKFGITFKLFSKIEVNGENTHPLYKYLKEQKGFGGFDPNHPLTPLLESGNKGHTMGQPAEQLGTMRNYGEKWYDHPA